MGMVPAAENIGLLSQLMAVIRAMSPEDYRASGDALLDSGVGGHVRHMLDHYRLLLAGLPGGRVDYEPRARDPRVERDPAFALTQLEELMQALQRLPAEAVEAAVTVQSARGADGQPRWCGSTVKRELDFLASHDVHHQALIASLLRDRRAAVPDGFGIASSTRRHLESQASCAR